MSTTSRYSAWNAGSDYHALREIGAAAQVSTYLKPYIEDYLHSSARSAYTIADFACGHGSISKGVLALFRSLGAQVPRFGLLDVAADNLPVATQKLMEANTTASNATHIDAYKLNGSDLNDYRGERFDFDYCWDAMVHFDILDVAGYLKTFSKLCRGRAVFHHSNYFHSTTDIKNNPHWRNFMNQSVFQQLCISSGLKILDQQLIS